MAQKNATILLCCYSVTIYEASAVKVYCSAREQESSFNWDVEIKNEATSKSV